MGARPPPRPSSSRRSMARKKTTAPAPQVPRFFQRSPIDLKDSIYHPFDLGQVEFLYPLTSVQGMTEGEPHHARVTVTNYERVPYVTFRTLNERALGRRRGQSHEGFKRCNIS